MYQNAFLDCIMYRNIERIEYWRKDKLNLVTVAVTRVVGPLGHPIRTSDRYIVDNVDHSLHWCKCTVYPFL